MMIETWPAASFKAVSRAAPSRLPGDEPGGHAGGQGAHDSQRAGEEGVAQGGDDGVAMPVEGEVLAVEHVVTDAVGGDGLHEGIDLPVLEALKNTPRAPPHLHIAQHDG